MLSTVEEEPQPRCRRFPSHRSRRQADRFYFGHRQAVVHGYVRSRLPRGEPAHDVRYADAPPGDGRLATVQPRIHDDVRFPVLREFDPPGPAVLIGDPGQVITDDRPEDLLAAADHNV